MSLIIGVSVGAVVLIILVVILVICLKKMKSKLMIKFIYDTSEKFFISRLFYNTSLLNHNNKKLEP